jgi:hypothetical protein
MDMRHRNPYAGLVVLLFKLRQRGYSKSISGLYKLIGQLVARPVKFPNPKYMAKPYEKM